MKLIVVTLAIVSLLMAMPVAGNSQVDDLVAYWKFDGDPKDATGNGHDGQMKGVAALVKNDGAPIEGPKGAVKFLKKDGNAVQIANSADLRISQNLTLMAWANPDDSGPTQYVAGVPHDDQAQWDDPWVGHQIGVRGGAMATWLNLVEGGVAKDREYDSGKVASKEWTHLAFVFTGDEAISYVNGEEVANHKDRKGEIQFIGDPLFMIGERSHIAIGEPFGGLIDEVALFKAALSEDDINEFMSGIPLNVQPGGKLPTSWGYVKSRRD